MVGLINAITMSVLERTREIGILRCVGARMRHPADVGSEGVALALAGWRAGIPLGYAFDRSPAGCSRRSSRSMCRSRTRSATSRWALAGIVIAVLVVVVPTRRAAALKPGDALRYA